ncbi:MAG: GAF domain-containing protein [Crocinitomicaceae bacterium]
MSHTDTKTFDSLRSALKQTTSKEDAAWCLMDVVFENSERYVDAIIYLLDDSNDYLIQTAAKGEKVRADHMIKNPIVIQRGEGIVGWVLDFKKPRLLGDTTRDRNYIIDDRFRLSELAVPIINDDRIYGVIDSEHSNENYYTKEDQAYFEKVAGIFAEHLASL